MCGEQQWEQIADIELGVWDKTKAALKRETNTYPIGQCYLCNHVQVMTTYSPDLFELLDFHSTQEAVFWHEFYKNSDQPYIDMVNFFSDWITPQSFIVDFGCGLGNLLTVLNQKYQTLKLLGIDFNNRMHNASVPFLKGDLNNLSEESVVDSIINIDIATIFHTLEHIVNPVDFLKVIAERLSPSGIIFIEVPSFSYADELAAHPGQSNLVTMQHIHYYTHDSIRFLASRAGLIVENIQEITTGYIPRLQVVLKKGQPEHCIRIKHSAANALLNCVFLCHYKRQRFARSVEHYINKHGRVGIWGVGADTYALLKESPHLHEHLHAKRIELFDYELSKHTYLQEPIHCSTTLVDYAYPVLMSPMLAETRIKMHAVSKDWNTLIIDAYGAEYDVNLKREAEEQCKICHDKNWHPIDELISGRWLMEKNQLIRKNLFFPIGECKTCKHVQATIPYHESVLSFLYSDSNPPLIWCDTAEGESSPYCDMLDFFADTIKTDACIVELGCGEAKVLNALASCYGSFNLKLIGLDFHNHIESEDIAFIQADLNDPVSFQKIIKPASVDLIISAHVLEHLVNPVEHLAHAALLLKEEGCIFIEVPDCAFPVKENLAFTYLVCGQHIHYYTLSSLQEIARLAGLNVMSSRHLKTGNIPRLQVLLTRAKELEQLTLIQRRIQNSVPLYFIQKHQCIRTLADIILENLAKKKKVGLWGLGADFILLIKDAPEIIDAIKANMITLFDYELSGHLFLGQKIRSSSVIKESNFPVFIVPLGVPTRNKMRVMSEHWDNVWDIFSAEESGCPPLKQEKLFSQ